MPIDSFLLPEQPMNDANSMTIRKGQELNTLSDQVLDSSILKEAGSYQGNSSKLKGWRLLLIRLLCLLHYQRLILMYLLPDPAFGYVCD